MSRKKTTGNYATREELIDEIKNLVALNLTWVVIARRTGVSQSTAINLFQNSGKTEGPDYV